jgi:hypothetical protein
MEASTTRGPSGLVGVERGCVGVDRRGALLGPEGSGRPVLRVVLVFLGHLLYRLRPFVGGGWCGGVAGASLHQTPGGDVRMGCFFPVLGVLGGWWWFGVGVPARILRTV